jgi:hypothetical protein
MKGSEERELDEHNITDDDGFALASLTARWPAEKKQQSIFPPI